MAIPAGIAFAAPLVANMIGQGANMASQGNMNKKNREFAREQANLQYGRDLENWQRENEYNERMWWAQNNYNLGLWNTQNQYNEQWWNKQNQYNSPAAQMERFKEAGLNPNLIYGQSNMGGSVSTANLEPGRFSSAGFKGAGKAEWRGVAPQFDFLSGIMAMAQFKESAARTDNLETQNKVLEQDALLRVAQTASAIAGAKSQEFDLGLKSELRKVSVDAAEASLRKLGIESDLMLNRDEREEAMNASNLREASERILNYRGQRKNMEIDSQLKMLDLYLKRLGIQPSDNIIFRILGQFLQQNRPDKGGNYKIDWNQINK